ncbi:AAA-like domain-containing protein [Okeania sp. SIO1I7]|uniref:AAA-like domain-containing protein n=1 Tax=Okeania sp. SIO1I7 TaxID=2607772 RepID=UPI0013FB1763|nr:AAA-like domain-containing protein [Okeania sp. SIO1I7]NET28687.1 hypothetical protein [Okeania sp. SIO1I7]
MNNYEYYLGGSLPLHATTYVKRQADEDLYQGLKNGYFCYVLNSRQMGKSSLRIKTIQRLQQDNIACVTIDMTEIGTDDITSSEWYASIIDTILTGLNLDDDFDIDELWDADSKLSNVKRFSKFISEILLPSIYQNIVIFIDEIDSTLSLPFNIDDFFAVIRSFYNKRDNNSDYQRLTFAMIGVATPADLIKDKKRTPFNIDSRPIKLIGFRLAEVEPLAQGLVEKTTNINKLMEVILDWTGGQPFLTQKVCKLIQDSPEIVPDGQEAEWVANLVRQRIIDNWQVHDDQQHLKTIRDRLLFHEKRASRLLGLYQQVLLSFRSPLEREEIPLPSPLERGRLEAEEKKPPLSKGGLGGITTDDNPEQKEVSDAQPPSSSISLPSPLERAEEIPLPSPLERGKPEEKKPSLSKGGLGGITTDDSPDQMELRLTGLVIKQEGQLQVANRIYQEVFNLPWVEKELGKLRPYSEAFNAWQESGCQDESRLLRGQALADALAWSVDKSLSDRDYQFLTAAQEVEKQLLKLEKQAVELEKLEAQVELDAQLKANKILDEALIKAKQKAKKIIVIGLTVSLSLVTPAFLLRLKIAQEATKLEQAGVGALRQFKSDQIKGLREAMLAGQKLQALVENSTTIAEYPVTTPLLALQNILDTIEEKNWWDNEKGEIKSVSFSPDGKKFAAAGYDGIIRVFSLSGEELGKLEGHKGGALGGVNSISFSPDGKIIASAGGDETVRIWDISGKQLTQIDGQTVFNSVSFSPDGKTIATAADYGEVKLWNLSGKEIGKLEGYDGGVNSVTFSSDGEKIATAGKDGIIRLWNNSGKELLKITGHQGQEIFDVSFSPDGKYLATAAGDNKARIWNLSGEEQAILKEHQSWVMSVNFSPNSQRLVTASDDGTVRLWNLSGQEIAQFSGHLGTVWDATFSPNGRYLVTAGRDGKTRLWDVSVKGVVNLPGHQRDINTIDISADGQYVVGAGDEGIVSIWDVSGKEIVKWKANPREKVLSVSFSPNGKLIGTVGNEDIVRLWDISGKQITIFKGHKGWVNSISFSRDGKFIATAGADKTARIWNFSGEEQAILEGHQDVVSTVRFSADEKQVITAGWDGTIRLWNFSGNLINKWQAHRDKIRILDMTNDGKYLATADDESLVIIWDIYGDKKQEFSSYQNGIYALSFSPDGEYLVTGGMDGSVKVWDLQGRQIAEFNDEKGEIWGISFGKDGRVAIGGHEGLAQLWEFRELDELLNDGCEWLQGYIKSHSNDVEIREVCQDK